MSIVNVIFYGIFEFSHHFQRNYNGMKQEAFYIQNLDRWETSVPNQQATRHHIVHLNRLNLSIMSRHWATSSFQWASAEKTSNLRHPHEEQGGNENHHIPTITDQPLGVDHCSTHRISHTQLAAPYHQFAWTGSSRPFSACHETPLKVTARVLNTLVGGKSKGTCDMVHD